MQHDLCDVDRDGAITDVDGVNVLRAAALLPGECDETTPPPGNAFGACEDNCQAAEQICDAFFDDYDSVADCTEECLDVIADFPSDAGCVNAQVQFIECCTNQNQCPHTDGCRAEFDGAVDACGGAFGGCPLIFF